MGREIIHLLGVCNEMLLSKSLHLGLHLLLKPAFEHKSQLSRKAQRLCFIILTFLFVKHQLKVYSYGLWLAFLRDLRYSSIFKRNADWVSAK